MGFSDQALDLTDYEQRRLADYVSNKGSRKK
jgi:hypothetical protein